jgi:hypothetical protein
MAKHYSKRASKKRAYKKRRTIRKLKTTLRRKMQRGGGDEDVIIRIIFKLAQQVIPVILSLIKLGDVKLLMSIITLLSGNQTSIGPGGMGWSGGSKSNNRQLQRGGGLKETVLGKLDELAIKFKDKPDVADCIEQIKARIIEQPEPAATALDSSVELDSLTTELTTELTTDTKITQADKDIVAKQDSALKDLVEKDESVTSNTSVNDPLPHAIKEAAKMSIIRKMITLFNERIKSKITAKLDGMISNLRGKVDEDVIACIRTLKTAIVEDIVTQIKNNVSEISSRILDEISRVLGVLASEIITFLAWSAVQIALKNYSAIPREGLKLLGKLGKQAVGAVAGRVSNLAGRVSDKAGSMFSSMSRNTGPVDSVSQSSLSESISPAPAPAPAPAPEAQPKQGLFGRIGSVFGRP